MISTLTHFILFLLLSNTLLAYEQADAFIIQVLDEKVKVVSPKKYNDELTVIIQNKTLVKIIAKLEGKSGTDYSYFSISAGESQSRRLSAFGKEPIFFKPLSPSLQKVSLRLGSLPYEIPAQ
jgi:hypothetical protein